MSSTDSQAMEALPNPTIPAASSENKTSVLVSETEIPLAGDTQTTDRRLQPCPADSPTPPSEKVTKSLPTPDTKCTPTDEAVLSAHGETPLACTEELTSDKETSTARATWSCSPLTIATPGLGDIVTFASLATETCNPPESKTGDQQDEAGVPDNTAPIGSLYHDIPDNTDESEMDKVDPVALAQQEQNQDVTAKKLTASADKNFSLQLDLSSPIVRNKTPELLDDAAITPPEDLTHGQADNSALAPNDNPAAASGDNSTPESTDCSTPALPHSSTPASSNDSTPVSTSGSTHEPGDDSTPALVDDSTPAPVGDSTSSPVDDSTPAPVHNSSPAPTVNSAPGQTEVVFSEPEDMVRHKQLKTPSPHQAPNKDPDKPTGYAFSSEVFPGQLEKAIGKACYTQCGHADSIPQDEEKQRLDVTVLDESSPNTTDEVIIGKQDKVLPTGIKGKSAEKKDCNSSKTESPTGKDIISAASASNTTTTISPAIPEKGPALAKTLSVENNINTPDTPVKTFENTAASPIQEPLKSKYPKSTVITEIESPISQTLPKLDSVTSGVQLERSSVYDIPKRSTLLYKGSIKQTPKTMRPVNSPFIDLADSAIPVAAAKTSSVSSAVGANRYQDIFAVSSCKPVQVGTTSAATGNAQEKTNAFVSSSSTLHYSIPSAAEREEEMRAMQRDCHETSVTASASLRGIPVQRRYAPSITRPICSVNSCVPIKRELSDINEITSYPLGNAVRKNVSHTDNTGSKHTSPLEVPAAVRKHQTNSDSRTESSPVAEQNKADTTSISSEEQGMSNLKNQASSLRQQQLDCLSNANGMKTYTPPVVPTKFNHNLTNTNACTGCDDVFLFESSLETHTSRKSLCIVCKHKDCLGQIPEKIYTNRCVYISHLKTHQMSLKDDIQFTISGPTDEMLDSLVDMVKMPTSQAILPEGTSLAAQWKCIECKVVLDSAQQLADHFVPKGENGGTRLKCGICSLTFLTACSFTSHRRTHIQQGPYICPECGLQFLGPWEVFERHLRQKCFHAFRTTEYKCSCCSVSYSSIEEVVQHALSHKEMYYKCLNCPMAFKSVDSIKSHMMSSHGVDSASSAFIYKCAVCDTVFHSIGQLEGHTRNHINDFNKMPTCSFMCWLCKQFFSSVQDFEGHLTTAHNVKYPRIMCDLCGEHYKTLAELCKHLENHQDMDILDMKYEDVGREMANSVGEGSTVKVSISKKTSNPKRKHVKAQTALIKMFRCSVCDFKCNKDDMIKVRAHIQQHRQEGIFLCPNCFTAKFEDWTDLHRHQFLCRKRKNSRKDSTDAKNSSNVCCKCGITVPIEEDLEKHMQSEHGIAPQFPCHLCGLTYDSRRNLKRHVLTTHEGKKHLFLCWICYGKNVKKTFSIASKLKKHLIAKHRVPRNTIDVETFPRLIPGIHDKDTVLPGPSSKRTANDDTNQAPIKRLKVVGDAVFNCAKCEFSSEDKETFNNHIKQHKSETDSKQCPECGLCFSVLPSLKKHLIMVHKIEDVNKYIENSRINEDKNQDYFSISAAGQSSQPDPLIEEGSGNPLECRVCHRTFESVALLKTHMRTHGMAFIRSKRSMMPSN